MPENPEKNYNFGLDPKTKEIVRTDQEKRFNRACSRLVGLLRGKGVGEKEVTFAENYLAFHLDLEDEEVSKFFENLPGVSHTPGTVEYSVTDILALREYLHQQKVPEGEDEGDESTE